MGFGRFNTFPIRFGGGRSRTQDVLDGLNADMGDAYNVESTSAVYAENLAFARAISRAWGSNQRLANYWVPLRMCPNAVGRWETILALAPGPDDSYPDRRERIDFQFDRFQRAAIVGELAEQFEDEAGAAFVAIEHIPYASAVLTVPDGTYPWGTPDASAPWSSTTAHILVRLQKPDGWSEGDFYDATAKVSAILDTNLPSWATFDWYRAGGLYVAIPNGPSAAGFYLDDENNLDNQILDDGSAPSGLSLNVVCVGDSLTYGANSSDPGDTTSYPYYLAGLLTLTYNTDVRNLGVSGLSSFDLPDPDYLLNTSANNQLILMIGINDIVVGAQTPADVFARVQAYVAAREAKGWTVTVCTIPDHHGVPAEQADIIAYNTLLSGAGFQIADIAADPDIGVGASSPSAFIHADNIHWLDPGNQRAAEIIEAAVDWSASDTAVTATADGIEQDASLTHWLRDWNTITVTTDVVTDVFSLTFPHVRPDEPANTGYFQTSGSADPPTRVLSALDGYSVINFPGVATDALAFFQVGGRTMADYITASEFVITALVKPEAVLTNSATPYVNEGVFCDNSSNVGLFLKNNAGAYSAQAYCNDGGFSTNVTAAFTINTWVILSMRLLNGQLGISVNGGAWVETACGDLVDLTGAPRIGRAASFANTLDGKFAEVIVRNAWDATRHTADLAYLHARYPSI